MRFPMFSDDQIVFYPVSRAAANPQRMRGGFIPRYTTRTCPRTTSPSPCTGPMASVIPLVMGPFKGEARSCSRDPCQHHRAGPPPARVSPPRDRGHHAQPDHARDAVSLAQGLLGELFGLPHPQSVNTACGDPSSHQPSSTRRSAEEKLVGRKPARRSAPCRHRQGPPPDVNSSEKEAETKLRSPSKSSSGKNESAVNTSLGGDGHKRDISQNREWSHTVPLPGFEPSHVSVKVKRGQVYVRAVREEKNGAGRCVRKLEMQQTVTLPETADSRHLSCSMKSDGTLLFRAPLSGQAPSRTSEEVKTSEHQPDMPEHRSEKTVLNTESDSQDNEIQEATQENNDTEETFTENVTEKEEALDEKAHSSIETDAEEEKPDNSHTETATEPETLTTNNTETHEIPDDHEQEGVEGIASPDADTLALTDADGITSTGNVPQAGDTEKEETETEAGGVEISFPIVEEPDDSVLDENEMFRKSSMTEDFVLVEKDTSSCDTMNSTEELNCENTADAENKLDNDEKTHSTHDKTDPTRPIRRTQTPAHAENELNNKNDEQTHSAHDKTDPTRPIRRTQTPAPDTEETAGTSHPVTPHTMETTTQQPGPFRACLPLAGFSPEDVHISVEGRTLHISATRQAQLGQASYTECVSRCVELPQYLDVYTVRCVYERDHAQLVITADPLTQQHHVPVVVE